MIWPNLAMALQQGSLASPLDPRLVPGFNAGAIWHPGYGVSSADGDGNRTWTSIATAGTVITTVGSFQPPTPSTASNGAPVWLFNGANGSLHYRNPGTGDILGIGPEVRFRSKGVIAGWFKAGENDAGIHNLFTQWSGDSVNDRINISTGVSSNPMRMVIVGSDDGTSTLAEGVAGSPISIVASTNTTPIVITSLGHPLISGMSVTVAGHLVNTSANGNWKITKLSADTFSIPVAGVGVGVATGTVSWVPHRWKDNRGSVGNPIDYTRWNGLIWIVDFENGVNSGGPPYLSTKVTLAETSGSVMEATGFSAPPDPYKVPPDGPIMGDGLFDGASRFTVGGDYISSCWWTNTGTWQIGSVLIAHCDSVALPSLSEIQRCLAWQAPA